MTDVDKLLHGSIDLHMHPAPDVMRRRLDALEAARQAQQAGMRAIVIKNHFFPTAPIAQICSQVVSGIQVFGSLTLNQDAGGFNPSAVKNSAILGAKILWMPTVSAAGVRRPPGASSREKGLFVLDSDGKLKPELSSILELVKQNAMVLATGHISPVETRALIEAALKTGITKMVITHPLDFGMTSQKFVPEELHHLAQIGAFIELTFTVLSSKAPEGSLLRMLEVVKAIGVEHFIMSTDLGQANNPPPVEGLKMLVTAMLRNGITSEEIELMIKVNPGKLLGLN